MAMSETTRSVEPKSIHLTIVVDMKYENRGVFDLDKSLRQISIESLLRAGRVCDLSRWNLSNLQGKPLSFDLKLGESGISARETLYLSRRGGRQEDRTIPTLLKNVISRKVTGFFVSQKFSNHANENG